MRLTKLNLAICDYKVGRVWVIVHLGWLIEELEQALSVNKTLVDRAIDAAKHGQGTVELLNVGNEEHKIRGLGLAASNTEGNNHGTQEQTKTLEQEFKKRVFFEGQTT
jgi:hypothetical protein